MHIVHRSLVLSLAVATQLAAQGRANQTATVQQQSADPVRGGRPITSEVIRNWNTFRGAQLSNDGKWFVYVVGASEGDATLVLQGTAPGSRETRINVGSGGGTPTISGDSKWMYYTLAPSRPAGRATGGGGGARGGGAGGGGRGGDGAAPAASPQRNKIVLMNLASGERKEFDGIRRFVFNAEAPTWIAMQGYPAGAAPAPAGDAGGRGGRGGAGGGGGGGGGGGAGGAVDVLLYNMATAVTLNMGLANDFAFNEDGTLLAYTKENADQVGNAVQIFHLAQGAIKPIDTERALYRSMAWMDSVDALTVMRGKIDSLTRDTLFSLVAFRNFRDGVPATKTVFNPAEAQDWPAGMKVAADRAPRFTPDFSTVFFGIREARKAPEGRGGRGNVAAEATGGRGASVVQPGAPGAGGTISGPANQATDVSSLILWHWKDTRPQPAQILQESADRSFNYLTAYRFNEKKVIRLVTDDLRNVTMAPGDRYAIGTDNRAYQQNAVTTGRNYNDVYLIDLTTGSRKLLFTKVPSGSSLRPSPDGKRALYWGTDGHYWVMDIASGEKKNITKGVTTSFVDTEDDHNNLYPPAIAPVGWTKDGSAVLLNDNWDIWKVPVDGSAAVNLTGDGRKNQVRYRSLYNFAGGGAAGGGGGRGGRGGGGGGGIDLTKPLYIGTYGEWTKKEGISKVDPAKPGAEVLFSEPARFNIQKARDAETYLYTRQTFTEYPDYWLGNGDWKAGRKVTDINPQIKDLAWSSGTKLIDYKATKELNNARLQAAMYLPANFDPTKKYPMLVTIYEKRSQGLNSFVTPSETRTPDPALYTSRGYIVLDPDIVYKVNDPGMSAVWCVIPAVQAAIATGFVDAKKVGLWGHSWGGYQTSHLVTQTNIFAAAIAGAPLTNMISMYGSMYWNSGGTDAAIFESSQGRFKGSPLHNMEAYVRNSPVYFADKVQTPLVILHNDKDGAVDFNQGVTYYNTLVNLGKNVMMWEYMGENHGVSRPVNQRDYASRMREFFDHYLMDKPAPEWMTNGVPRLRMDEHLRQRRDSTGVPGGSPAQSGGGRGGPGGL